MTLVGLKRRRQRPKRTVAATKESGKLERKETAEGRCVAPGTGADLELALRSHAAFSSQLATQLARTESAMIAFIESGSASNPDLTLNIVQRLERVRRSATEDLRQSIRVLDEIKHPPVSLAAVLKQDQRAFYASGSSKVFKGDARKAEG